MPIEAFISEAYPHLKKQLNLSLEEIIAANKKLIFRGQNIGEILQKTSLSKSFQLFITDSGQLLPATDPRNHRIYFDVSYFRLALKNLPKEQQRLGNIAFVIAHEIAHSIELELREKGFLEEKSAINLPGMEDFCDALGLELMHNAGYDLKDAHFRVLGSQANSIDSEQKNISLQGRLSFHPHTPSRNDDLERLTNTVHRAEARSSLRRDNLFSDDTKVMRELEQQTKYEKWMNSEELTPYKTMVLVLQELNEFSPYQQDDNERQKIYANTEKIIDQSMFSESNKQNLKHIFYAITQRIEAITPTNVQIPSHLKRARHEYMKSSCTTLSEIQDFFKEIRSLYEILNTPGGKNIKGVGSWCFTEAVVDWVQAGLNKIVINPENITSIVPLIENINYNFDLSCVDKLNFQLGSSNNQEASIDSRINIATLFNKIKTIPDKSKTIPDLNLTAINWNSIFNKTSSPNEKTIPSVSQSPTTHPNNKSQDNISQKLSEEIEKIKDPYFLQFIIVHTNLLDFTCKNFSEAFKTKLIENETLWKRLEMEQQRKIIGENFSALIKKLNNLSDQLVDDLIRLIYHHKTNPEFASLDFLSVNKNIILERINQIKNQEQKEYCKSLLRSILERAIKDDKKVLTQDNWIELFSISFPETDLSMKEQNGIITHQNTFINNLTKEQLISLIPNLSSIFHESISTSEQYFLMALEQRFRDLIDSSYDTKHNIAHVFDFSSSNNFLIEYFEPNNHRVFRQATLDTQIFVDKSGREISDADKQTLIGLCHPNKQSYYLQTYLQQKENSGQFTADLLLELYDKLNSESLIYIKSNYKPPLSEAPGFSLEDKNRRLGITVRDMMYFRYFHNNLSSFIEKAKDGKHKGIIAWFQKYYPKSSSYRDVVLNQIYNHDGIFEEIKDKNIQKEIIGLFHDENKSSSLKLKYYNQYAGLGKTLHEDLSFLFEIYPDPSPERDIQIEKILDSHPFNLQEFNSINKEFSVNSLKYLQKADSAQTWMEEYYAHLSSEEKCSLFLWMIGKQNNKPISICNKESYLKVDLSELKDLFQFKSYRDSQIQALFAGQAGLFAKSNQQTLDNLLEKVLADYFVHEKDADVNKLKDIFKFCIKKAFHLENNVKKLKFMQNLVDLLSSSESKTFEDFACNALSISPVFVKLGQALGSQIAIKQKFPVLYSKLQSLKDNNQPLSYLTLMQAIATQSELAKQDITILQPLATASIGGTWLALINGQKKVIKVIKAGIANTIQKEKEEFTILKNQIIPEIKRIYGLEHVPDLENRIFHALEIEANLREEAANNKELGKYIKQVNSSRSRYEHAIPDIDEKNSNAIILVQDFIEGESLSAIQQRGQSEQIEKLIKESFWKQVQNGFFHGDPHSGNFIIKNNEIYWIDTGLCVKLPDNLVSFLKEKEVQSLIGELSPDAFLKLAESISQIGLDKIINSTSKEKNHLNIISGVLHLFKQRQNISKYYKLYSLLQKHNLDKPIIKFISQVGAERIKAIYEKVNKATPENRPLVLLNELDAIKDIEKPIFVDLLLLALGRGSYLFS